MCVYGLPGMNALVLQAYISGKSLMPTLQLLNNFISLVTKDAILMVSRMVQIFDKGKILMNWLCENLMDKIGKTVASATLSLASRNIWQGKFR